MPALTEPGHKRPREGAGEVAPNEEARSTNPDDLYEAALASYYARITGDTVGSNLTIAVHPDSFYANLPLLQRWLIDSKADDDGPRDFMLFEMPAEVVRRRFWEFVIQFNRQQLPLAFYALPKPTRTSRFMAASGGGAGGASAAPTPQELEGSGACRPSLNHRCFSTPDKISQGPLPPEFTIGHLWRFWRHLPPGARQQVENAATEVHRLTHGVSWADQPRELK